METAAGVFNAESVKGKHGHHGVVDEVRAVIEKVDLIIDAFAAKRGLVCSAICHERPDRTLVWGNGVRRFMQISLECKNRIAFRICLIASLDRQGRCLWKREHFCVNLNPEQLEPELPGLLAMAYQKLNSWPESSLTLATEDFGAQTRLLANDQHDRGARVRQLG